MFDENNEDYALVSGSYVVPVAREEKHLVSKGWVAYCSQFDPNYFFQMFSKDPSKIVNKTLTLLSELASISSRTSHSPLANALSLVSSEGMSYISSWWGFITPPHSALDARGKNIFKSRPLTSKDFSSQSISLMTAQKQFRRSVLDKALKILGCPSFIYQSLDNAAVYCYPVSSFTTWETLISMSSEYYPVVAYWESEDIQLVIERCSPGNFSYALSSDNLLPLIRSSSRGLHLSLSGHSIRIGELKSSISLSDFDLDIQQISTVVLQLLSSVKRAGVLAWGKPGTGKSSWAQAFAKEVLEPLGYTIFILDLGSIIEFSPPGYLNKICVIVNDIDHLALDRGCYISENGKTESLLGLLDGTLHNCITPSGQITGQQSIVYLFTCNNRDKLDPAFLRTGRIDVQYEFTHVYAD